jgi:hypothetical protein
VQTPVQRSNYYLSNGFSGIDDMQLCYGLNICFYEKSVALELDNLKGKTISYPLKKAAQMAAEI